MESMIVSRYIKEETDTLQADVEFITPAFLGGADGNAELRAAPFKGMLRYWWRILYGAKYTHPQPNGKTLQQKEAEIFGATVQTGGKSSVLLNLHKKDMKVSEPLFDRQKFSYKNMSGGWVNTADYLAYGHYEYDKAVHRNQYIHTAIQQGSSFSLTLTVRKAYSQEVFLSFLAMMQYGGIGSKCRNGFGSMRLIQYTVTGTGIPSTVDAELKSIIRNKNIPVGFSALSSKSRLYKTKYAAQCWEDAFVVIAQIYIAQLRRCIAQCEKTLFVAKNSRLPKFLLLSVTKEGHGFYGQILALPINFDYIMKGRSAEYNRMVEAVYTELDGIDKLQKRLGD